MTTNELKPNKILRGPIFPEPVQVIVSWVSQVEDAKESLLRSHWDLIIADGLHKMSAASCDKKTLACHPGEVAPISNQYLLMKATSHKAEPNNAVSPAMRRTESLLHSAFATSLSATLY